MAVPKNMYYVWNLGILITVHGGGITSLSTSCVHVIARHQSCME